MNKSIHNPCIDPEAYLSPGVWVVGDVRIARLANIWFGSVLRGDINYVEVGEGSNIQDQCVLHVTRELPCRVGAWVTVGHRVVLHGCRVEDRCLIGMGAVVLNDAIIGEGAIVGAGSVVPEGMQVPPESLALGVPARVIRPLRKKEQVGLRLAKSYVRLAKEYRQGRFPLFPLQEGD